MDTLSRCRSVSELRQALRSLPKDLDDTYARILKAIDDDGNYSPVSKILRLLVGSNKPITIDEAAETIPIELDMTPQIDLERRLVDSDDVLSMCSALVVSETQEDDTGSKRVLRLAHFSIREYLLSTRIQESTVSHWQMDTISCHIFIARLFIAYILFLEIDIDACADYRWRDSESYQSYPLAVVATSRWPIHLSIAENSDTDLTCGEIGSQLFTFRSAATRSLLPQLFPIWHCSLCLRLLGMESELYQWDEVGIRQHSLLFTAHFNLPQTTGFLLARGANPNTPVKLPPTTLTTALAEASYRGHVSVVKKLLAYQADIEFEDEECPNALKEACRAGNTGIVRLLLDHGADPNARLPGVLTALGAALLSGSHHTGGLVNMLLEAGVDIADPFSDPWLFCSSHSWEVSLTQHGAIECRDTSVIKVLLDNGANGVDGLVASCGGNVPGRVLFFLDSGFDINARASALQMNRTRASLGWDWTGHTALEHACATDNPMLARILLERGADPNLRSPLVESVLEIYFNRPEHLLECEAAPIFVLLLEKGADLDLVREDKLLEHEKTDGHCKPGDDDRSSNWCENDQYECEGKSMYRAVLDRWRAWKAGDSMSPNQILGRYRRKCADGCPCAEVRSNRRVGCGVGDAENIPERLLQSPILLAAQMVLDGDPESVYLLFSI